MKGIPKLKQKNNDTPLKAIRAKCYDCVCGQVQEINKCIDKSCPLWAWRTGHRPKIEK